MAQEGRPGDCPDGLPEIISDNLTDQYSFT